MSRAYTNALRNSRAELVSGIGGPPPRYSYFVIARRCPSSRDTWWSKEAKSKCRDCSDKPLGNNGEVITTELTTPATTLAHATLAMYKEGGLNLPQNDTQEMH